MADLGLADAVNATEALLDAVRVPRQVVVDHQVRALQVDALPGGIGGEENLDLGIVTERLLRLQAFLAAHAAVDDDDCAFASQQGGDAPKQITERIAVLGEQHQLLVRRRRRRWNRPRPVRRPVLGEAIGNRRRGEDLAEQGGQFAPLRVGVAVANGQRLAFEAIQRLDLGPQLGDAPRRGGLVEDLLLRRRQLIVRRVLEVIDGLIVKHRRRGAQGRRNFARPLQQLEFAQPAFEPLAPPAQATGRSLPATRRAAAAGW